MGRCRTRKKSYEDDPSPIEQPLGLYNYPWYVRDSYESSYFERAYNFTGASSLLVSATIPMNRDLQVYEYNYVCDLLLCVGRRLCVRLPNYLDSANKQLN